MSCEDNSVCAEVEVLLGFTMLEIIPIKKTTTMPPIIQVTQPDFFFFVAEGISTVPT